MLVRQSDADFARRVLIVAAIAVALAGLWILRQAELMLFGAILLAVILRSAARLINRHTRLPVPWALALATTLILAVVLGFLSFFGVTLEAQVSQLLGSLPGAYAEFRRGLAATAAGRQLDQILGQIAARPDPQWLLKLRGYATEFGRGLVDFGLIAVAGVYLAAQPRLYREGILTLTPPAAREPARRLMDEIGAFLSRWITAQLISMVVIGVLFAIGLRLLGVPAAAALGVFAGLAEFIPMFGPIIAAVPALLMAVTVGWYPLLWTFVLYVGIHVFESNLLQPLLQRGFTSIPPVLNLFALVVFGIFFGVLGVILAAPLAIVCVVAVQSLYLGQEPRPPPVAGSGGAGV